jgi:hypothetical protein
VPGGEKGKMIEASLFCPNEEGKNSTSGFPAIFISMDHLYFV